jgi:cytosine/adenosine deaminase-related metal-dependent hydrolase
VAVRESSPTFASKLFARARACALACAVASLAASAPARAEPPALALVGGTLVDLDERGRRARDIDDGVVIVEHGRVRAAGRRGEVEIPAGTRTIDVRGRFLVPGLVDGFAGMNSAAQARAYLHAGVTTIVGVADRRRGELALAVAPRPRVLPLEAVGYGADGEPAATAESVRKQIDALAASGVRVLLLMYPLPPESLTAAVLRARELGLATIGELGETPYPAALALGVQALVHTSRYSLALAPEATRSAVAKQPFGPPKLAYYEALVGELAEGPGVAPWAKRLGESRTALIPTLAMEYLDLPGHANPWLEAEAKILDPAGIHLPAERATGARAASPTSGADAFPATLAAALLSLEARYAAAGARYLAGSGTSAFGTMPGISLRHELELLVHVGLTPRQALAAATENFREAFGWKDLGCLAAGCVADVLVLRRDPTADLAALREIEFLIVGGELVDRAALLAP